jgi:sugar phosphate isomerase/epimerase
LTQRSIGLAPATLFDTVEDRRTRHLDLIDAAAAAQVDAIAMVTVMTHVAEPTTLTTDAALRREVKTRLRAHGITVVAAEAFGLHPNFALEDFEGVIEASADLGAAEVLTVILDPDLSRAAANLRQLSDRCCDFGVTVSVEFVPLTPVPSLGGAARFLDDLDCPDIGIVVDPLHLDRSGSMPAEMATVAAQRFHYAHFCDAVAEHPQSPEGIRAERIDRRYPGDGGLPLHRFLDELPPAARLVVEAPFAQEASLPAVDRAVHAITATRRYLQERGDEVRR